MVRSVLVFSAVMVSIGSLFAQAPGGNPGTELVVVMAKPAELKSCATDLATPPTKLNRFRCGRPGATSEIHWELMGRSDVGDVYRFSRSFPADAKDKQTSQKEVIYTGREQIIWQDSEHIVSIRPKKPVEK